MIKNKIILIQFFVSLFIFLGCSIFLGLLIEEITDPQEKIKIWANAMIFLGTISFTLTIYYLNSISSEHIKESNKEEEKKIQNKKLKKMFCIDRIIKSIIFSITIGLGAYLGKIFLEIHWLLALGLVAIISLIFFGELLDILFSWKAELRSKVKLS